MHTSAFDIALVCVPYLPYPGGVRDPQALRIAPNTLCCSLRNVFVFVHMFVFRCSNRGCYRRSQIKRSRPTAPRLCTTSPGTRITARLKHTPNKCLVHYRSLFSRSRPHPEIVTSVRKDGYSFSWYVMPNSFLGRQPDVIRGVGARQKISRVELVGATDVESRWHNIFPSDTYEAMLSALSSPC